MSPFVILAIITLIFLIILRFFWSRYNSFVIARNQVKNDFSDIEVQLKRKASLIERLVTLVREYAKHESGTFEEVAKARSALDTSKTAGETAAAENMLSKTLRSLFAVVENYPKLVASENFQGLRDDLKQTEDNIAKYREVYNETVKDYNNMVQTFPNLLAAGLFKFYEEELFQVSEAVANEQA